MLKQSWINRISPMARVLVLASGVMLAASAGRFPPAETGGEQVNQVFANPRQSIQLLPEPRLAWAEATAIIITSDSIGSGALVSAGGHVLTNAHVVRDELTGDVQRTVRVLLGHRDGEKIRPNELLLEGVVEAVDTERDLALVKISSEDSSASFPFFPVATAFHVGQKVWSIGSPGHALPWTIKEGAIVAFTRFPDGTTLEVIERAMGRGPGKIGERTVGCDVLASTTPIAPGDSGGPLVNIDGELVGLNFAGPSGSAHGVMAYHIALDEIQAFLASHDLVPPRTPRDSVDTRRE